MSSAGLRQWSTRHWFTAAVFLGLGLRILIVSVAGNQMYAAWSGGGDTAAYVTLAENLLEGKGFSFAGQPSAFRPPGYPMLLAGMKRLSPTYYFAAVRWLQFALGLATAYLCAQAAARLFGDRAWRPGFAVALLFPTLPFMTGEVLTESVGAFLSAVFIYLLVEQTSQPSPARAAGLGFAAGLASLFRFNMAVLVIIAVWAALKAQRGTPRWQHAALTLTLAAVVVTPWVARNVVVFHGEVIYSTQSGLNAVAGVVAPQGRALPAEQEKLQETPGWISHVELETNDPSRRQLPSEQEVNRQAWRTTWRLWEEKGWRLLPIILAKLTYFWLSTDQLLSTQTLPAPVRWVRAAGVMVYWFLLFLAVPGWLWLRKRHREIAKLFLLYAVLFTVLHLPFVMNTRLRVPVMDPLLAMLAGGGSLTLLFPQREEALAKSWATAERGTSG